MGNVMCCCKGRDKSLEDGKSEDSAISSFNRGLKKKKKKKARRNDEILESDNSMNAQTAQPEGGNYQELVKESNNANTTSNMDQGAKHISNFSTFGGDNLILHDDDDDNYTSSKKGVSKPTAKKFEVNTPSLSSAKSVSSRDNATAEKPIPKISSEKNKNNNKIYLRINIEYLDILYKLCDDFGITFKPYLEIHVENQEVIKVFPQSDELDKSLNTSYISGVSEIDMSSNISMNLRTGSVISTSMLVSKERNYIMKFVKFVEIPQTSFYSNINFIIKNELPGSKSKNIQQKEKINLPPNIIIGESKVPINLLYKYHKEGSFDGNLELKLKNLSLVGYLKVNIIISDKTLIGQEDFFEKLQRAKFLDVSDDDNSNNNKMPDTLSFQLQKNQVKIWKYYLKHYNDFNPNTIQKYFQSENKEKDRELALKNKKNDDCRELYKYFIETTKNQNLFSLYQILILLVKLTNRDDFKLVGEFFKLLDENEKNLILELPKSYKNNAYILKNYLIFLFNYMKHFKNNKVNYFFTIYSQLLLEIIKTSKTLK